MSGLRSLSQRIPLSFLLFGLINNIIYVLILSAALDLVSPTPSPSPSPTPSSSSLAFGQTPSHDETPIPKGLISLVNILPSLLAKLLFPYLQRGAVSYPRRVLTCWSSATLGVLLIALSSGRGGSLGGRLGGIAFASFACGLGEITFLQMCTVYTRSGSPSPSSSPSLSSSPLSPPLPPPPHEETPPLSAFASGTGLAGLLGALLWVILRPLGTQRAMLLCSVLPGVIPLVYRFVLPFPPGAGGGNGDMGSREGYTLLDSSGEREGGDGRTEDEGGVDIRGDEGGIGGGVGGRQSNLTLAHKLTLLVPLIKPFIIPLFLVYLLEYTILTGISTTLLYTPPGASFSSPLNSSSSSPSPPNLNSPNQPYAHPSRLLSRLLPSLSSFYPLYSLTYQFTVLISRSSLLLGLPPLRREWLYIPAAVQMVMMGLLGGESLRGWWEGGGDGKGGGWRPGMKGPNEEGAIWTALFCVALVGVCGGLAFVNVYHHLIASQSLEHNAKTFPSSQEDEEEEEEAPSNPSLNPRSRSSYTTAEKEFRIASLGISDSFGILLASLISMPLELALCAAQVRRGRDLCRQV